jgi:phage baseplate assembly protein W
MASAKSYSFSSVGVKKNQFDAVNSAAVVEPPIGIKTPLELGSGADGIFRMHRSLAAQIKDNLINLLMTNQYERLNFPDFGANLKPLIHELGSSDGDEEAMARIQRAVSKYMPFVVLENFSTSPVEVENSSIAQIKMVITYSVPRAQITEQTIGIIFNFGG